MSPWLRQVPRFVTDNKHINLQYCHEMAREAGIGTALHQCRSLKSAHSQDFQLRLCLNGPGRHLLVLVHTDSPEGEAALKVEEQIPL